MALFFFNVLYVFAIFILVLFQHRTDFRDAIVRAARYSKINLDIILPCLNIQDNTRCNINIQFSIQYQDCGAKNVKNLALS